MRRRIQQTSVIQTYDRLGSGIGDAGGYGVLGAKPPAAGRFFSNFFEKPAILMPLDHNSLVFRAI